MENAKIPSLLIENKEPPYTDEDGEYCNNGNSEHENQYGIHDIIEDDNDDDENELTKLNHSIKMIHRLARTNHALSRSNRMKLCCLKTWSCERLTYSTIILLCCTVSVLCGLFFTYYVEKEWKTSLHMGMCVSNNCTQINESTNKKNNSMTFLQRTICSCNISFVPYDIGSSPMILRNYSFIKNFSDVSCPASNKNNQIPFAYACSMNEIEEVWEHPPDLWIIRLLVVFCHCIVAGVLFCVTFAVTDDSILKGNVNTVANNAYKTDKYLQSPPEKELWL